MIDFGKVITAMVTPFNADNSLDLEGARKLARYLIEHGTDTILLSGTTGESPTLKTEEKIRLIEAVKEEVGSVPVMAGTGSNCTASSVEDSASARQAGADALLLVVPYYNKPNQEGLYQHFKAIAESTDLPCMLYNVPGRTSKNLEVDTTIRLSNIENIVALKAACGSLDQVTQIRMGTEPEFMIYSGDDMLTLPMLAVGARGVVSVGAHLVGGKIQEMIAHFNKGEVEQAKNIHMELYPFFQMLFMNTNPIPIKYATSRLGLFQPVFRLPMTDPTDEEKVFIDNLLMDYGLL